MGDFLFTSLGPIYGNFFLMNVKYQPKKKSKSLSWYNFSLLPCSQIELSVGATNYCWLEMLVAWVRCADQVAHWLTYSWSAFPLPCWQPGLTLSPKRWKLLHNEEGVLDIAGMIKRVQRGVSHIFSRLMILSLFQWWYVFTLGKCMHLWCVSSIKKSIEFLFRVFLPSYLNWLTMFHSKWSLGIYIGCSFTFWLL
jgi:hypothetical protein